MSIIYKVASHKPFKKLLFVLEVGPCLRVDSRSIKQKEKLMNMYTELEGGGFGRSQYVERISTARPITFGGKR